MKIYKILYLLIGLVLLAIIIYLGIINKELRKQNTQITSSNTLFSNTETETNASSSIIYPIDSEFATSSDNRTVYFIRDIGDHRISGDFAGIDNLNQIISRDLNTGKEEIILKSGHISDFKIVNLPDYYPIKNINTIRNLLLSYTGNKAYFEVPAWVTSDATFSIDLNTKIVRYITNGTIEEVIKAGKFKDNLIVYQRGDFIEGRGVSYCYYIVEAENGKRVKDLNRCD